jgi:hypothetical protein
MFTNVSAGDYTLLAGSPCVDAGTTSQPPAEFTLDLAHRSRVVRATPSGASAPDLGAYERPCAPPSCPGDLNGDGAVNTIDLTGFLGRFGTGGTGNPADLNGDGSVNTADLVIFLGRFGSACPTCP